MSFPEQSNLKCPPLQNGVYGTYTIKIKHPSMSTALVLNHTGINFCMIRFLIKNLHTFQFRLSSLLLHILTKF